MHISESNCQWNCEAKSTLFLFAFLDLMRPHSNVSGKNNNNKRTPQCQANVWFLWLANLNTDNQNKRRFCDTFSETHFIPKSVINHLNFEVHY